MTPPIEMQPLSQKKRRFVFLLSLLLFVVAVPISVFYAIGYRFDFGGELSNIKSVGGMYVRNDTDGTEMFVNDEPVRDMRVFQRAAYIQNLEAGMHRIHVQGDGLQTWVKELPVYAHFVTEVSSFNMPSVPQVRLITAWNNPVSGAGVVFNETPTSTLSFASITNTLEYASTSATSTLLENTEHVYVTSLMASSTENKAILRRVQQDASERFTFGSVRPTTTPALPPVATTTVVWRDFTLYEKGDEVYVRWNGSQEDTPYYYCVLNSGKTKTAAEYGLHVYEALLEQIPLLNTQNGSRVCRTEIRIDRLWQEVQWFGFYPDSADIVLMQLQDGLYAIEVDDRAWQNTQLLYPGDNLQVVQDGGRIYVQDGDYLVEVFTEIAAQ